MSGTSAAETPIILAFDEGTTSARTIAVDKAGQVVAVAQREFPQRYPSPGDVRHDPEAIWDAQIATAREVIASVGGAERVVAIGITNQRETALIWDRTTGRAVADAIRCTAGPSTSGSSLSAAAGTASETRKPDGRSPGLSSDRPWGWGLPSDSGRS